MKKVGINLAMVVISTSVGAASFDCSKSASHIEHMICSDSRVSSLDEQLAVAYKNALKGKNPSEIFQIKSSQKNWINQSRNICKDHACLINSYEERISDLVKLSSPFESPQSISKSEEIYSNVVEIEDPSLEAKYIKYRDAAYDIMAENTLGSYGNPIDACKSMIGSLSITDVVFERLNRRCVSEVGARVETLRAQLISGAEQPKNCKQWAIMNGESWQNAKVDVQYSPLSKANGKPVQFNGKLINADENNLVVYNRGLEANFITSITDVSFIVNGEGIKVDGFVSGYGVKIGKTKVPLVSGRETTIPIIEVRCIQ